MKRKIKKPFRKQVARFDALDWWLMRVATVALTITVAKLWTPVAQFEWYWYALIFIVAATKPFYEVFWGKKG